MSRLTALAETALAEARALEVQGGFNDPTDYDAAVKALFAEIARSEQDSNVISTLIEFAFHRPKAGSEFSCDEVDTEFFDRVGRLFIALSVKWDDPRWSASADAKS